MRSISKYSTALACGGPRAEEGWAFHGMAGGGALHARPDFQPCLHVLPKQRPACAARRSKRQLQVPSCPCIASQRPTLAPRPLHSLPCTPAPPQPAHGASPACAPCASAPSGSPARPHCTRAARGAWRPRPAAAPGGLATGRQPPCSRAPCTGARGRTSVLPSRLQAVPRGAGDRAQSMPVPWRSAGRA